MEDQQRQLSQAHDKLQDWLDAFDALPAAERAGNDLLLVHVETMRRELSRLKVELARQGAPTIPGT
jgi:hypothetical protein